MGERYFEATWRFLMKHCLCVLALVGVVLVASPVAAQESAAAKATRKKLTQKIGEVDWKDVGVNVIFDDLKREMDPACAFKIDNTTGLSNNSKLTYKAKNKTVEEILNDLSEKGEFGWFVKSDPKDRNDGFVILRKYKDKERGYEGGKEPKKGAALDERNDEDSRNRRLRLSRTFTPAAVIAALLRLE